MPSTKREERKVPSGPKAWYPGVQPDADIKHAVVDSRLTGRDAKAKAQSSTTRRLPLGIPAAEATLAADDGSEGVAEKRAIDDPEFNTRLMSLDQVVVHSAAGDSFLLSLRDVSGRLRAQRLAEVNGDESPPLSPTRGRNSMARMETTTNATIDLMASGRNTREGYEIVSDPVVQARIDATNASLDKHRLEMEKKFPLPSALRKQKEEEERRALEESVKESVANVASVRNVLSSLKASKSFAFASGSSKRQGGSNDGSSRIAPQASAPDLLFVKDLSSDAAAESTAEAAAGAAAAAAPEEESAPEAGSPPVELAPPPVAAVESVPGAFGITEFGVLEEESQAAAAAAAAGGRESTAPEPEPEPPAPNTGVTLRSLPGRKAVKVFEQRCRELGITPSTTAMAELANREVRLGHCNLGRKGAEALSTALPHNTAVALIDLQANAMDTVAVEKLLRAVTRGGLQLPKPMHLELETALPTVQHRVAALMKSVVESAKVPDTTGLFSSPAGAAAKADRLGSAGGAGGGGGMVGGPDPLLQADPMLAHLSRSQARLTEELMSEVAKRYTLRVGSLNLSENEVGLPCSQLLSDYLDPSNVMWYPHLTVLELCHCAIPDAGGELIMKALSHRMAKVTQLRLGHNQLGNRTAGEFATLLAVNRTLTHVDLSWNAIRHEGADAIAEGLAVNRSLVSMDLSWNGLDDAGVMHVAKALGSNETLTSLDLSSTRFGPNACIVLALGIRSNKGLTRLALNGNHVGRSGARHLMGALVGNRTLQQLGLRGCNLAALDDGTAAHQFDALCPDGAYRLVLATPGCRTVIELLCELETSLLEGQHQAQQQASQEGGVSGRVSSCFHNIKVDGVPVASTPKQLQWPRKLPENGIIAFTFESPNGCSAATPVPLQASQYGVVLHELAANMTSDRDKLDLLVALAPFCYLTCTQIRGLVQPFVAGTPVLEAASVLLCRALDEHSALDDVLGAMHPMDVPAFRRLTGWYCSVRFVNPYGHYELDLAQPFHYHLAVRLKDMAVAAAPRGSELWMNVLWTEGNNGLSASSSVGPFQQWYQKIPSKGVLAFDYVRMVGPPGGPVPPGWSADLPLPPPIRNSQLLELLRDGLPAAAAKEGPRPKGLPEDPASQLFSPGGKLPSKRDGFGGGGGGRLAKNSVFAAGSDPSNLSGGGTASAKPAGAATLPPPHRALSLQSQMDGRHPHNHQPGGRSLPVTPHALQPAPPPPQLLSPDINVLQIVPLPVGDFEAADAQVCELRHLCSSHDVALTCEQLRQVVRCFASPPHRVEAVVMFFYRLVDREKFWVVLYDMSGLEQVCVSQRLCIANTFDSLRPSVHYLLDSHNEHQAAVLKRLATMAPAQATLKIWNARNKGESNALKEDAALAAVAESSGHSVVELDFLGQDTWELVGAASQSDVDLLPPDTQLSLRRALAAYRRTLRIRQLYSYWSDSSIAMLSSRLAPWQLYEALMAPNVAKPPWLAAWDRMVRFIMRFDQRDHQMGGESPLHGLFVKHATASTGRIGADGFRRAMRSCGLNRAAVEAYCKEFKASVKDQLEAFTSNDRSRRKQIEVIFLSEANERRKRALGPGFGGGGGRNARGGGGEDKVSKKRVEQKLLEEALISRSADDPLTDRELQLLQELGYSQFAPLFMQDRMPPSGEYVFAMVSDEGGMTPPDEQVAAEESGAAVGEASAGGTA